MELVVFACLLAEPRHCEEFHVPFVQPAVVECMSKPTTREVIRWAHEHPLWTIKSWTCGRLARNRTGPESLRPILPTTAPLGCSLRLVRPVDLAPTGRALTRQVYRLRRGREIPKAERGTGAAESDGLCGFEVLSEFAWIDKVTRSG